MTGNWPETSRRLTFLMGLCLTIYFAYLVILIVATLLITGTWPPLPPDPGKVTVDLLQSLGFLVALTALMFAIALRVLSRCKDYSEAQEEALQTREKLDALNGGVEDEASAEGQNHVINQTVVLRLGSGAAATFRGFVASVRMWYPWFILVHGLIYVTLRGQWLISNASFPSVEDGPAVIRINVMLTISFLMNWSIVVFVMTERIIHVGRNMQRVSRWVLEDAKTDLQRFPSRRRRRRRRRSRG